MSEFEMCTDFIEIVTGTKNTTCPVYQEAAKAVKEGGMKSLGYLKNFITSIEEIDGKEYVQDKRISDSRGNLKNFSGYENIETTMEFLEKNVGKIDVVKDLVNIHGAVLKNQDLYTDCYEKNIRLGILEYESSVYLLITGLASLMANSMELVQTGDKFIFKKKNWAKGGVIEKSCHSMATELMQSKHREYLQGMIQGRDAGGFSKKVTMESTTYLEGAVGDTIDLLGGIFSAAGAVGNVAKRAFFAVKNTVFGIVPIIRSIMYLRYKKKADTILELERQANFIRQNIEMLQNKKGMDQKDKDVIIKKQKATAEAFIKRANKLRAQLAETERSASEEIKKDDQTMGDVKDDQSSDDEFVLEDYFTDPNKIGVDE